MTSTHDICQAACGCDCICGACAGTACVPGHYHLARVARAAQTGAITLADFASVIWGDVFYGLDTIPDPGPVPAEIVVRHAFGTAPVAGAL